MPSTTPAYTIGGITRPALIFDNAGNIVLTPEAAAFAAAYGIKALYLGVPANTPYPPVAATLSAPADANAGANTVLENAAAGTQVGLTAQANNNGGPPITYSLTENAGGRFQINANTGVVTVANASLLDYETATGHAYSVTVQATDGIFTSSQAFAIGVGNVNEAPAGSNGTVTATEDTNYVFTAANLGFTDPSDSSAPNSLLSVRIATLPAAGTLLNNGNPVNAGDFVTAADIAAGHLVFVPAANASGAGYASLTFQVRDNGGTANGGVDTDASANTLSINVTAANDAPSFSIAGNQTAQEDAGAQTVAGFVTASSPGPADEAGQTVSYVVSGNSNAGLFAVGPSIAADGTLTYTAAANAFGVATITVHAHDNGGTAPGVDNSPDQTFTITIGAVNDAPTATNLTQSLTVNEDAAATTLFTTPPVVSDVDSANVTATLTLSAAAGVLNGAGAGVLDSGILTYTITGSQAAVNAALAAVTYDSAPDFNGSASVGVTIDDGASGPQGTNPTGTVSITVNAVNDAPTAINLTQLLTINEDAAATTLFTAPPVVSDVDSANVTATLKLSAAAGVLNGAGAGVLDSGILTYTITGSQAAVNAALAAVTYDSAPDFNGSASVGVTIDDGASGPQGTNPTGTVSITVNAVNDAPTAINLTQLLTINEDAAATTLFTAPPVVSDVDSANVTATLKLSAAAGVLNGAGAGVLDSGILTYTITGSQAAVNAALAAVTYDSAPDFNGSASVGVTIDDGASGPQGTNPTGTVSITVTAVNDAPTATNLTQSLVIDEDVAATTLFTLPPVTADVDSANVTATLTLNAAAGFLNGAGAAVLNSGILTYTITGSPVAVNAALAAVTYDSAPDFNGTTSVGVTIDDGASGPQGTNPTGTVSITVNAVNDAPVLTSHDRDPAYATGVQLFDSTSVSVGPADESAQGIKQLVLTVSNVDGTGTSDHLSIDGTDVFLTNGNTAVGANHGVDISVALAGGTATVTISKTAGDIPAADVASIVNGLTYTNDDVTGGESARHVTITSIQDSGGTAPGVDTSTPNIDSTVTFNLPPVIDSNGAGSAAAVSAAENQTAVTTVHAIDLDNSPVTPVAYSIVGGDDALKFAIDSGTGVLTFITPPDFENPTDTSTAGNNTYIVTVQASDGAAIDQQTITVTVTDVNDAPVITSNGGGATASINVNENSTAVTTVTSTDQESLAQTLTYSLNGGADAGKFSIDPGTGVLTFNTAPNFEVPTDTGGDNGYDVIVRVTDNGAPNLHDDQAITVHVQDVNEAPDTAAATVTGNEDQTGPAYIAITITGSDVDASDSVASFHITNVPNTGTQGTLYSDVGLTTVVTEGANVTASGNAATLYFVPNPNYNTHAGAVTFNAAATDTLSLTDATPATETINVTAVDDAPINNGLSSFVTQSGFAHPITGLSISDIDANEVGTPTDITTTFTAGAGTVSIGNGTSGGTAGIAGGATIMTNGSGTVVLTGTTAEINTTLGATNGVVYTAADNAGNTTTTITMTTNDQGHNGTGGPLTDVDTIQVGVIPQVWFINNAPGAVTDATAPVGSQANPFPDIAAFNASSGPGPNDYIYVKAGTYSGDGINLKDGQTLLGDDQPLSFTNPLGGPAIQIEDATGTRPTIHVTTAGDQGIDVASGNTIHGINIQTDAGNSGLDDGVGANSVGTLTVSDVAISGVGKAVDLDGGGTLAVTLESISSTGASADGIDLNGVGGNLTVTGGTTVSNAGTTGIHVQNSTAGATFNFGNTNVTGAAAIGVDLTTNTGNVTFADLDINGDAGARSLLASGNTGTITSTSGTIVQSGGSGGVGISGVDATHKTTLNMTLDSINVSGTATTGVDVALVSGSLTVGTTTIANNTLVGVQVQTTAAGSTIDFGNTTVSGTHTIDAVRLGTAGNGNAGNITFDDLDITTTSGPGLFATGNTGITTVSAGTINTGANTAIDLASNTGGTFNFGGGAGGVDITTTSGTGFSATGGGTVSVAGSGNTIGTTSGTALNLANVTIGGGGVTFDTVTTTGAANGIVIDTVTGGAINVNAGSIAGASSHGVDINAAQSNITIAASITSTSAGNSVEVTNSGKSGGNTITFSGAITDPGHGINLDNNDQNGGVATINFTGKLDIDSTTFKGFSATNGGTVNASNAANSISTTSGTALTVTGTTIGASNLVFHDISSNGAVNGILLNNTGTSGHLTVTGTGSTDGTGGTIQNTTGHGISLTNTQDVNLKNMNINGADGNGIFGNTVNGLVLSNLNISGNGDSTAADGEGNIYLYELTGNASHVTAFDDLNVTNSYVHNVFIQNTTGTLTDLVVTNSNFSNNGASTVAGSQFTINLASGGGTPTATVHATHNTFSGNLSTPATFTATGFQGSVDKGTLNVHLGDGTAGGLNTFNTNNSGITLSSSNTGSLNFDVNNNTITNNRAVGVAINHFGTGTVTGFFQNNTIGTQGVTGSGSQLGNGLDIHDEGTAGTVTLSVTNNIIQSVGGGGLGFEGVDIQSLVGSQNSSTVLNITFTGNTIRDIIDDRGLFINEGNLFGGGMINALVSGNTFINANASGANTTARVGGAPGGTNAVNVTQASAAALAAANGLTASGAPGNTMRVDTNVSFNHAAPPLPPATPQMALHGQGPGSSEALTTDALAPLLAVAIAHWAAAGASAAQIDQMLDAQIRIADLPNSGFLANSDEHGITIDSNAAGWGWFIDSTPADNAEFQATTLPGQLEATGGSAASHIDLLTVLVHELGHMIGLPDTTSASVMNVALDTGERRLPDATDVALADVDLAAGQAPLLPVIRGTSGNDTIDAGHGGAILVGEAGADNFVFADVDVHGSAPPPLTHVADYHFAEGDTFDFSALTSAFHPWGIDDTLVVRAVEDASGTFATLQVNARDPSWSIKLGPTWVDVAQLDGAHAGDDVSVLIDNNAVHAAHLHVGLLA